MADVITRLKLETTQYDSKLRDATQGMRDWLHVINAARGDFSKVTEGQKKMAETFGSVAAGATNSKDKLRELVSAYNAVAKEYNMLDKELKQSDIGKTIAAQMEVMRGRIAEAKQELYSMGNQSQETGGILGSLADKFTINIDAIKIFNAGLSAVKGAMDVVKDAFFTSETNVDAWGMTVQSATTIYDTFVQSLNSGNFSNFFTNLDNIISKAQDAYKALDNLGTVMTIINPERAKLQARQTELKATIRREGATSEAGKAAQQELRDLEPKLSKAFKKESKMNYDAFSAEVDRMLATAGITLDKKSKSTLMRSFSDSDLFETLKRNAKGSKEWTTSGTLENQRVSWTDNRNVNQKLLDLFTDDWRKQWSPLLTASYSARGSAASSMLGDARYLRESVKTPGGGGGSAKEFASSMKLTDLGAQTMEVTTSMKELQAQLNAYKQQLMTATNQFDYNAAQQGIEETQKRINAQPLALQLGIDVDSAVELEAQINDFTERLRSEIKPLEISVDSGKTVRDVNAITKGAKIASQAISTIGTAFSAIEDPAAKIAATVAQAIASVALAYADAMAKDKTQKFDIFGFIAATAAATISMATTIAAIHKQTGYAEGGIIPGNSYSGDNIGMYGVNAGEVVLNRAQSYTLAAQLTNNEQGGRSVTTISGEQIILAVNAFGRRTGRGELIRI